MNLGQYIKDVMDKQGRKIPWVVKEMNKNKPIDMEEIPYNTFKYQLDNNSVWGMNLLLAAIALDINLEELKEQVKKESA
jgi:hypothetical protein